MFRVSHRSTKFTGSSISRDTRMPMRPFCAKNGSKDGKGHGRSSSSKNKILGGEISTRILFCDQVPVACLCNVPSAGSVDKQTQRRLSPSTAMSLLAQCPGGFSTCQPCLESLWDSFKRGTVIPYRSSVLALRHARHPLIGSVPLRKRNLRGWDVTAPVSSCCAFPERSAFPTGMKAT